MELTTEWIARGEASVMQTYNRFPLALTHGEGMYVWDVEGKRYLDFVAGIAVNSLGYGHKKLAKAIAKQAESLIHCSNLYYTKEQITFAEKLLANSDFDRVFFCNSGAESIEGALKLCRKYADKTGKPGRDIIAMEHSFHGRTYGAVTATGQPKYQKGLSPLLPGIRHVPYNDIQALKAAVNEETCAVLLEPIQGEGGVLPADPAYLQAVRALCDEKGLLLVFDEVQCGVGRTGTFFAYQGYGVVPDIAVFAKGLAGGVPIGALFAKEAVAEAFSPGDHASTFGGNALACAAGLVVLEELFENGLLENIQKQGTFLSESLYALKKKHTVITDVRGKGLMQGIALSCPTGPVIAKCRKHGLLLVGAGSDVIRFVPAYIVTEDEIREAMTILEKALSAVE